MAASVPTTEPTKIVAGDTLKWTKSLGDYPASTWTLSYDLVNSAGQIEITASADGDVHSVTVAASVTADYGAGTYAWQAYVTSGAERYSVGSGTVEIKTNYAAQGDGYDARSHVKQTLDALEATIKGKASSDQLASSVGGVSLSRMAPAELREWRSFYRAEYARELMEEKIEQGLGHSGKVRTRFVG